MNRHPIVLEQRIQPFTVSRRRREKRRERILVHDHQVEEEHLHAGNDRDDVGNQLAMTFAVDVHGNRAEDRQQKHPEHDRAVEPAPIRGDLVEDGLDAVGVMRDVLDREVVRQERVDHDARGHDHERRDQVKRADAAFNQTA